ncbi:MAG: 1-acyl-sn-glycerol-3-phosphate acyltransferase [Propionibacterium sp.]|nr:MAG: 1-acyl-sn-glycerol-3-phosphate acyltransferase [Propionibacterium sp.]
MNWIGGELTATPAHLRRLSDVNHEETEPTYRFVVQAVRPLLRLICRHDWRNQDRVPAEGAVIFVANHISYLDPIVLAEYLIMSGRWPRYLGKSEIFRVPILGTIGRACGQIPVERGSERAADSLIHATEALKAGRAICMYPEGTLTRDPDGWPMTGRTGAARLALATGVPVVPVGQWGAQEIVPGPGLRWPRFSWRRRTVSFTCGEPIDLSDLQGQEPSKTEMVEASNRMMDAITDLVATLRDEPAPLDRYDSREGRRVPIRQLEEG